MPKLQTPAAQVAGTYRLLGKALKAARALLASAAALGLETPVKRKYRKRVAKVEAVLKVTKAKKTKTALSKARPAERDEED